MFAAIAGTILAAMPTILNLVETLFKKPGVQTGEQKMDAAIEMVKSLLEKLKKSGVMTEMPKDDQIREFIETALQGLKASGGLTGSVPAIQGNASSGVFLVKGSIVDLSKV